MLESLTIRHIALIDEASITFHRGLQVLTGETGAGKSIVVDAVNLILGGRADRDLIRTGCDKASVEAVFNASGQIKVRAFMENECIEYDGQTVTVYREVSQNGKNICRVCGVVIPLSRLKELASLLMDLHGQSEHQFLTDPEMHMQFLDQTGGKDHQELLEKVKNDCESFLRNHRAYIKLVRRNENREDRLRSLGRDLEELRRAKLQPGEDEALRQEKQRLQIAEKASSGMRRAYESIASGDSGASALSRFKAAADLLKAVKDPADTITELAQRAENLYYEMEEVAYQLSLIIEKSEADPARLEQVEERLDLIRRLERKYGLGSDELFNAVSSMEAEYEELCGMEDRMTEMAAQHKKLLSAYRASARELTNSRHELAKAFEANMMRELNDLGMGNTKFCVDFKANDTGKPLMPTEKGDDRIEFLISPNPGEPLKPLARIASGGELSRLMLAIKSLEASHNGVESMVFDEIDTGISGRMAQVVAEKMIAISGERQVICVTHLPQLAAAADYQYLVSKDVSAERTHTSVKELNRAERIQEVGRMISGADGITPESTAHAQGMLSAAEKKKKADRPGGNTKPL